MQVARDPSAPQRSLGYGFVQYREFSDGVKAMQHWNAKQLGGMQLDVQMAALPTPIPSLLPQVPGGMLGIPGLPFAGGALAALPVPGTEGYNAFIAQQMAAQQQQSFATQQASAQQQLVQINELDEADEGEGKGGLRLDAQKRMALMQRLAATAGIDGPKPLAASAPVAAPQPQVSQTVMLDQGLLGPASPIPTPCILLKNMFDPAEEEARGEPNWPHEVEADVKEECTRFGEVLHVHVDRNSKGFVYVRFAQQQGAEAAHRALNLRWYSGKQVRDHSSGRGGRRLRLLPICFFVIAIQHGAFESLLEFQFPIDFLAQVLVEYQFVHVYSSVFKA